MSASSSETSTRRQKYLWGASAVVLILVLFITFSRRDSSSRKNGSQQGTSDAAAELQLHKQLLATLDGLLPERLHVSSDERNIVGDLNLWWAGFLETADLEETNQSAALVRQWLGDEAAENAAAKRFSARDASHIRNALMCRAIAESLVAGHTADRDRVRAAFELVVRQIAPMSSFVEPAPLGAFEVLLTGRGTPEDRIWMFAEILRQLSIDCVVIEPKNAAAEASLPGRLVGAIVEGEGILLFDPQLGLPIPLLDDSSAAAPESAATFSDARQNDALFRQFDVPGGASYPWSSAALADVGVKFVLDSTYAAPRMLALQTALPEQFAATLFDGPPPSEGSPTLEERVIAAGEGFWTADSVSAWKYPEQQSRAYFAAGGEDAPEARNRLATLYGPKVLRPHSGPGGPQWVSVDSGRPLRMVRVQHLRGELLEALRGYGEIRSAPTQAGNAEVIEDARHWVAVCQEELERYDAAVDTLKLLLRDYPSGLWRGTSQRALARCEALRGNVQEAADLMPQDSGEPMQNLADAWLVRRWQSQGTAAPEASADSGK